MATTIDPADIQRFSAISRRWWDPEGPFRPLHWLNPVRLRFAVEAVVASRGGDAERVDALAGLAALDVGCGGGLLSEALARRGATVTAVDADAQAIEVARAHAAGAGLAVDYHAGELAQIEPPPGGFALITASEVIEHVSDVPLFLDQVTDRLAPGGVVIITTLNRTLASLLLGKVAAEYVLGLIPRGTHSWRQFLRPGELATALTARGCRVTRIAGIVPRLGLDGPGLTLRDGAVAINYALAAVKAG